MTKQEKNEVIELLKGKFSQYNNFYITDTESLSVAQVGKLRNYCFDKHVEMKVAKNTLIKKALESIDAEKYAGIYDSLHQVTALLFSENPKDPAVIISSFRKENNNEKPLLKAAFINGDVFVGDNQLKALTQIKTKNELIGDVIGLLQSPIQRVLGALQNRANATGVTEEAAASATEAPEAKAPEITTQEASAPGATASGKTTTEATAQEAIATKAKAPEAPSAEASNDAPPEA